MDDFARAVAGLELIHELDRSCCYKRVKSPQEHAFIGVSSFLLPQRPLSFSSKRWSVVVSPRATVKLSIPVTNRLLARCAEAIMDKIDGLVDPSHVLFLHLLIEVDKCE